MAEVNLLTTSRIQLSVEKFFAEWLAKWGISIGTGPRKSLWEHQPDLDNREFANLVRTPTPSVCTDSSDAHPAVNL
jgi:hypothetical protein